MAFGILHAYNVSWLCHDCSETAIVAQALLLMKLVILEFSSPAFYSSNISMSISPIICWQL
jgi:hypothetical protein